MVFHIACQRLPAVPSNARVRIALSRFKQPLSNVRRMFPIDKTFGRGRPLLPGIAGEHFQTLFFVQ